MIEPGVFQNLVQAFHSSRLGIGRPIIQVLNLGLYERSRAHHARFQGAINRACRQAPAAKLSGRVPQGFDFGVRGRILAEFAHIPPPADDGALPHHNRPYGDIPVRGGDPGLIDSQPHEIFVGQLG